MDVRHPQRAPSKRSQKIKHEQRQSQLTQHAPSFAALAERVPGESLRARGKRAGREYSRFGRHTFPSRGQRWRFARGDERGRGVRPRCRQNSIMAREECAHANDMKEPGTERSESRGLKIVMDKGLCGRRGHACEKRRSSYHRENGARHRWKCRFARKDLQRTASP